jgi:predicted O-methyltransferase YrrM
MQRAEYIARGRESVPGWFTRDDAELFCAIDAAQRAAGIVGDIMEIGCYQGSSAILLGYLRRAHERLIVCDLFQDVVATNDDFHAQFNVYGDLTQQSFEKSYLTFHDELPEIFAGSSTALKERDLGQKFRFIHIDGSHEYETVRSDLLLARSLLLPGGFVIFDDIISPHTPGVAAAVWEGVANDGLIPLYETRKLYGTWGDPLHVELPKEFHEFTHFVRGHRMSQLDYPSPARLPKRIVRRVMGGG